MHHKRFCLDRRPSRISTSRGVSPIDKRWAPGRTLKVRFLEGTTEMKEFVKATAMKWSLYANIHFDFSDAPDAEIRITFDELSGAWSAVGKDALLAPLHEPTMNLGWLDEQVVLHEFGHAIGLGHEHQNPIGGIQWNRELVYRELGGPPNNWSRETVDQNIFDRYNEDHINATELDPSSIMMYPIPQEWTRNNFSSDFNNTFSEMDKIFVAELYPYPSEEDNNDGGTSTDTSDSDTNSADTNGTDTNEPIDDTTNTDDNYSDSEDTNNNEPTTPITDRPIPPIDGGTTPPVVVIPPVVADPPVIDDTSYGGDTNDTDTDTDAAGAGTTPVPPVVVGGDTPSDPIFDESTTYRELAVTVFTKYKAKIVHPGEVFQFSFVAHKASFYIIETTGNTDMYMTLLGPENPNVVIKTDDDGGQSRNSKISQNLEPGRYYLKVRHYDKLKGTGSFEISIVTAINEELPTLGTV